MGFIISKRGVPQRLYGLILEISVRKFESFRFDSMVNVAQLAERQTVNLMVVSSNLIIHPNLMSSDVNIYTKYPFSVFFGKNIF